MEKNLMNYNNCGFEIIKQGAKSVIAHRKSDNTFVCWYYNFDCLEGKKLPNFYWGFYDSDLENVLKKHNLIEKSKKK